MKKTKKILSIAVCGLMAFSTVVSFGCGPKVIEGIDANKTQIYVSLYNGGLGTNWFDDLKNQWNAGNEKYEIIPVEGKLDAAQVVSEVEAPQSATSPSIYYSIGTSEMKKLVEKDKLEDLSDFVNNTKPDGADGLTIREKLNSRDGYYDLWSSVASHSTQGGLYMLPWNEAVHGFIYDHDSALDPNGDGFYDDTWLYKAENTAEVKNALTAQGITFEEEGQNLLFVSSTGKTNYKQGGLILRAGKDGVYGTYDDGQPVTMAEWDSMIRRITTVANKKAFMWTGQFNDYVSHLENAFIAQYSGLQSVIDLFDHDSNGVEYEMNDGSKQAFTLADGYKSYSMMGIKKTVEFIYNNLCNSDYLHPSATSTAWDHAATQGFFVMGYRGGTNNPETAMLIEGSWWEAEARTYFNSNANNGDADRGYGKRDYRYMLTPDFEGGVGPFGNGKGTAMGLSEISSIFVTKQSDSDKLAAIKDFIAFTLKEENLRKYTVETGVIRPYVYDLTDDDRQNMTPFANNNWDLYKDSENIALVASTLIKTQPISYATSGFSAMPIKANGLTYVACVQALNAISVPAGVSNVSEYKINMLTNNIASAYSADAWAEFVRVAKENGFYQNV